MKIVSPPFSVSNDGQAVTFTGYGTDERKEFNRLIAAYCVPGRTYQMSVKEVIASEVQTNYLHLCLGAACGEFGATDLQLRHFFYAKVLDRVKEGFDNNFEYNDWILQVIDPMTGELLKEELQPMHKWDVTMMRNFIDFVQSSVKAHFPDFVFPDPEKYNKPIRGRKNEPINQNVCSKFDLS
jgi:hypothetical protein